MSQNYLKENYTWLTETLNQKTPSTWEEITEILSEFKSRETPNKFVDIESALGAGTAFLTFDYGIDGVSIEISKYAQSLEKIFKPLGETAIHLIGGDFYPQADNVLQPEWRRHQIEGINGWSKWDGGKWFSALYEQEMADGSEVSNQMAVEIYRQTVSIAERLGKYLVDNQIVLLIPVNIASNPGNLALSLGLVFVTEALGTYVINSNHDFYWEGGKPAAERAPGEERGVRDHFFKNIDNVPFFSLFKMLYPWNGERWLQVNINQLQSTTLIEKFGFSETQVFELSTSVSEKFFASYDRQDVISSRLRMGLILSDGQSILHPIPVEEHLAGLGQWMENQKPCILGAESGLTMDPTSEGLIVLLQPTRVIARKRIEKDLALIGALLTDSALRTAFEEDPARQLLLHITGPTPREHQADLERVLFAYKATIAKLPESIANRVFLSFSVGNEDHPSFKDNKFEPLGVESIFEMADAIMLPSQTEGRGLPIVESSAKGIPIICSRYHPGEVFDGVVGKHLSEDLRLKYTLFPEGELSQDFVSEVADLLLHKEKYLRRMEHNKAVVRQRYSREALKATFETFLNVLGEM